MRKCVLNILESKQQEIVVISGGFRDDEFELSKAEAGSYIRYRFNKDMKT